MNTKERLWERWEKARDRVSFHDPLQNFRAARWNLPELNQFWEEVKGLSWPGTYGVSPWEFASSVSYFLFIEKCLPRSADQRFHPGLVEACRDLVADLPAHPDDLRTSNPQTPS